MPRFRLWQLFIAVTIVAAWMALLRFPYQWVSQACVSLALLSLLILALAVIFLRDNARRFAIGMFVWSGAYFALAFLNFDFARPLAADLVPRRASEAFFDQWHPRVDARSRHPHDPFGDDDPFGADPFSDDPRADRRRLFQKIFDCGAMILVGLFGGVVATCLGRFSDGRNRATHSRE